MLKREYLKSKPSNIYGLKYLPTLEPEYSDAADYIKELLVYPDQDGHTTDGNGQFSLANQKILRDILIEVYDTCRTVMEIGVARIQNYNDSSTYSFANQIHPDCFYCGIDTAYVREGVFTLDSKGNFDEISTLINKHIDVLFIDGNHSIDMMINDWRYSEYVSKGGYVLIHDTKNHPGPHFILDAIDRDLFEVTNYLCGENDGDNGIAVCKKLK